MNNVNGFFVRRPCGRCYADTVAPGQIGLRQSDRGLRCVTPTGVILPALESIPNLSIRMVIMHYAFLIYH